MFFRKKLKDRLDFLSEDLVNCDGCGGYFSEPYLDRTKSDLCKGCGGNPEAMGCKKFLSEENFLPFKKDRPRERIIQLERDIEVLRDHFQQLESLFHTTREVMETQISNLTEELKYVRRIPS